METFTQSMHFFRDVTTFSALPANRNTKSPRCNFFHCDPGPTDVPALFMSLSASLPSLPTSQTIRPNYRTTISASLCQRNAQAISLHLSAGLNRTAYTYLLHGTVLLEKLTGLQLVKKFPHFTEPKGSLPHSQASATCLYPGPAQSSPYTLILLPGDPS